MPDPCPVVETDISWQNNRDPWSEHSPVLATQPVSSGSTSFSIQMVDWTVHTYNQSILVKVKDGSGGTPHLYTLTVAAGDTTSPFIGAWALGTDPDHLTFELFMYGAAPMDVSEGKLQVQMNGSCVVCEYGFQVNPDFSHSLLITTGLIDLILFKIGRGDWAIIFDTFVGNLFVPGTICGTGPPTLPNLQPGDIDPAIGLFNPDNFQKFWNLFTAAAWYTVCQCVPATGGDPAPTDPTLPSPPTPVPPLPVPVLPVCDNGDICTTLAAIQRQIAALASIGTTIRAQVNLIQRQSVPFGYIVGVAHSALSGIGDFPVQGLIGVSVSFDLISDAHAPIAGDPLTYHQIGKVSIGTAQGWERSWMPTHSPYLILPITGAITKVGYAFPDGIVATITELVREP